MQLSRKKVQLLVLTLPLAFQACTEVDRGPVFDPVVGHPAGWVSDHGKAALDDGNTCPECHGSDLRGGASELSCFTTQFEGVGCHESSAGQRHTTGWALASEHGQAAKGRPGVSSGMASCQACHGDNYEGGSSKISCASCHGVSAPHPKAPWLGVPTGHDSVEEENAPVCAECHENLEVADPPACFNGSLCHGERGSHPAGWAAPGQHGAKAKSDPDSGGLEACQSCHGSDFAGGSSGVACSDCHDIDAPHPSFGWVGGGEGHRTTGAENASVCAGCHLELQPPPSCFLANGCHPGDTGDDPVQEPPPGDQVPPGDPAPPQDEGGAASE